MTFEQRMLFGLDEVKAIVFECEQCGAKTSIKPGTTDKPPSKCPIGHAWDWNVAMNFNSTESPFCAFLSSFIRISQLPKTIGFKMYLEIERPKD